MKTINKWNVWAIILVAIMSIGLVSCSKDDKNNALVGSWSCSNHYYGGSYGGIDTYVFKSNGTYEWSCTGDWWDDISGRYSYNSDEGILTIDRNGYTNVYIIASITDSSFLMIDEEGDYYTYYKNN